MNRQKLISCLLGCLVFFTATVSQALEASSSESTAMAKRNALDLAEALLNDGFRVRDGAWGTSLTPKTPLLLQVTLFSGNQYWFIAAAAPPAVSLRVTLYDAAGHLLKIDSWKDDLNVPGARAAEGFVAPHSGKYFVKLELLKSQGKGKADVCLVYAYK